LKSYSSIKDIILFGSVVKNKDNPKDIDLAIITDKKDLSLTGDIKSLLNIPNIDIEMITPDDMFRSRLGLTLMTEGLSIRKNKFLRDSLGISPVKVYVYEIKTLTQTKKVTFGRGLNSILKSSKGTKLGAGSVMVPIEQTGIFENFLNTWGLKYISKEYMFF